MCAMVRAAAAAWVMKKGVNSRLKVDEARIPFEAEIKMISKFSGKIGNTRHEYAPSRTVTVGTATRRPGRDCNNGNKSE